MTLAYRYRAARLDGTVEQGLIEVADRASALEHLNGRGLFPIRVEAEPLSASRAPRMSNADLALGLHTLATLLEASLPINRALSAFAEIAPPAWSRGLATVVERVRQGESLASALGHSGLGVPEVAVGIIQAAEGGSGLAAAVRRAAVVAESSAQLRASIANAVAYPAILAAVGGLSLTVIVGFVLPKFALIISDLGSAPPPLTRAVLAVGAMASSVAWPLLALVFVAPVAWRYWINQPEARRRWHELMLHLPLVGELRLATTSSRLCASLGALHEGGIPIAAGLQLASRSVGDDAVAARVLAARERVLNGARLSTALAEERAITPTARRLVRAGEDSGHLAAMLDRAARLDTEFFLARVKSLVRLIEPTLIATFALIIGLVAAALLQAVYAVRPG